MSLAAPIGIDAEGAEDQVQGILRAIRRHLAMDVGFVAEFIAGDRVFRYVDGETSHAPVLLDSASPLGESFCYYVARGLVPGILPNAAEHPITSKLSATHELPVGAHLSVPLCDQDGTPYGTLCCFSFKPDYGLSAGDLRLLQFCAGVVEAVFRKRRRGDVDARERHARIEAIIANKTLDIVYQPIYRTPDGRLCAFEALARFPIEPFRSPDAWFADGNAVGLGEELELLAMAKALEAFGTLDPAINLTINLSPHHVTSPRLEAVFAAYPLDRIVLELTENIAIDDYASIQEALAVLRARGLRIAIDDVGAGHSSFRHVLDLAPEFIKLDKSLIRHVDTDTSRRALATAITLYSREIGCEVIAEGVETEAEYAVLCELGMTRVQGYLTGQPMPLADAVRLSRTCANAQQMVGATASVGSDVCMPRSRPTQRRKPTRNTPIWR